MDATFWALAVPAVIFAGISKGGFGSGGAFAATPLMALAAGPGVALAVMLPVLMAIDLATLGPYRGRWSWPEARLLIAGALPGIGAGMAVYSVAPESAIRLLIGVIALGFVAFQMLRRAGWLAPPAGGIGPAAGLALGAGAGFTSFVAHAGGPLVLIYLLGRGLNKTGYQATTVLVFWAINLIKAAPYAWLGLFTAESLRLALILVPAALLGAGAGVALHRLVPERAFFALTYLLLALAGVKLISDALF